MTTPPGSPTTGRSPVAERLDSASEEDGAGRSRLERRTVWLLFGLALALLLLSAPTVHTEADDAFAIAHDIEQASLREGLSPRQPLFIPVMQGAFRTARAIGLADRSFGFVSVVNALFAAGAVALQYLLLRRRLRLPMNPALAGAGLLAATYGFWRFATEVEVYAMALFAGLLTAYLGFAVRISASSYVAVGVVAAAASMVHVLNGVVALVAVPVFLVLARQIRALGVYVAVLIPLLILGTTGAYLVASPDDESYLQFYASNAGRFALSSNHVLRAGIGVGQALISSEFLFSYTQFGDDLSRIVPERALDDEEFFGQRVGAVSRALMSTTMVLAVAAFLAAVAVAAPGVLQRRRLPVVAGLLGWLVVFSSYQIARGGSDGPEAWQFVVPPATMLVTVGLAGSHRRLTRAGVPLILLVACALLVLHNGLGIALLKDTGRDRNVAKAEWVLENTGPEDVVLTADGPLFTRYLRYEADAEVIYLLAREWEDVDLTRALERAAAAPGRVYATADVFDPPGRLRRGSPARYTQLVEFARAVTPQFDRIANDDFGGTYTLRD